ncbi:alpha/beta-hydrolase N-terminal domain-containing protein, partial [Gordonia sp. i37]|uniref:alpha/beta-hydrolase N-terminal domain-containing protein n=1 Tax=Gordonia sp. i37 TaxID=1961707 RepID=UPI0009D3E89B
MDAVDGVDAPQDVSAQPHRSRARERAVAYLGRISYSGLAVATAFLWFSATPSLLPRGPLFQGIVSGAAAAVGYCLGAFFAWLGRV